MAVSHGFGKIVTDGLVLTLDAADTNSYTSGSTTWRDMSGNGNNGTLTNGPTFDSANGGSIVFDGVDDSVLMPATPSVNIRGSVTVGMFCKSNQENWNVYWSGISKYSQFILGPNVLNSSNSRMAFLVRSNTWYPEGYGGQIWGQDNLDRTQYHYYVGRYNQSTGYLSLFVDGEEEVNFDIGVQTLRDDTGDYDIGKRDGSSHFLNFTLGIAQIYNRALTDSEILQNYNTLKPRFGL